MPPKAKPKAKQSSLAAAGVYPMLSKMSAAIGLFSLVPGSFWIGCANSDKDKKYKCINTKFIAVHTFSGGRKGAGFKCKEMGENGEGSLEPGAASGDEFIIGYPTPFLEYFYAANPGLLPEAMRPKEIMAITTTEDPAGGGTAAAGETSGQQTATATAITDLPTADEKLPIFQDLKPVSSTLATSGCNRGKYTNKYTCSIACQGGILCGGSITLYGNGKSETTSNGWAHIRDKAEKCPYHKAVLDILDANNSKRVQNADGYEPRAVFPHHEVQSNIALCIHELQTEERDTRYKALQIDFKGGPCIGLQLDMWTDTNTHVSYAGLNGVTLRTQSEVVDFNVFPHTAHTGDNIRSWLVDVMAKHGIKSESVSGVTPDGAADGQCGLNQIEDLREKVDTWTCNEHGLQRGVLYSTGLAGTTSKNPDFKAHLKGHNRIAQSSNQVRAIAYGIREAQLEADVPSHKVLTTVDTMPTRWGNQFRQVERDNVLKPVIDPVVQKWVAENRSNREAIVETDDANPTAKVGKAVPAVHIGLSATAWDQSLEVEAFLDHPFMLKEAIEHKSYFTGAQSLICLNDLKQGCLEKGDLDLKLHPATDCLS